VTKTLRGANETTQEIDDKNSTQNSLSPLGHFTEHMVGVFEKLLWENNLDHKSSRLSKRWLKSTPEIQPATNFTHKYPATLQSYHTIEVFSEQRPEPGPQAVLHNRGIKPDLVHQRESYRRTDSCS
jgi:hypothetical protein